MQYDGAPAARVRALIRAGATKDRPERRDPAVRGTMCPRSHYCAMQWIEALINISALVGFVGVANLGGKPCDGRKPTEPMA